MTTEWVSAEIDAICNVEYGTRVVQKKDGGTLYPVYGGGGATFSIDSYNRENRLVIARFAMSKQCTRFVKGKFFLNDSGLTISPIDKTKIDQNFLNYYCLAMNDLFYSISKGTAQKNLDVPMFRKLKISVPRDIKIQQKIVTKLDAIFAEIEKAITAIEASIKNTEALFQNVVSEMLNKSDGSWSRNKLINYCDRITDGSHFSPKTVEKGYPYITVRDIDSSGVNFSNCKYVDKNDFEKLKKNGCSPKIDDLLFSKDGTVGKVALVDTKIDFVVLSSLAIISPNINLINPKFLYLTLKSRDFLDVAIGKKTGAAIRRIILKNLKEIEINVPPISIQQDIVRKLDAIFIQIEKARSAYILKSDNLRSLKNAILKKCLMNEYFEN